MKFYIIAGEASGDLHGSNLITALRKEHPSIDIRCWGGDLMQKAGGTLVKHYRDLAFMGFVEVVMNLKTILRNIKQCKKDIEAYQPDALVLIDYPGFNMRIASWAHQRGIKVFYYISPQIWAWKQNRVHQLKRDVDRMFVVLPFEKDFYSRFQMDVSFVGHPLLDVLDTASDSKEAFLSKHQLYDHPIIALLPGSRKQEINTMLPLMLKAAKNFRNHQIIVAGAPGQHAQFYQTWLAQEPNVKLVFGATYDILRHSAAGLITSGTATLEAGLFKLPQVVCYKGNGISYAIAKRVIKVKYISLVNLILDKPAVKELIQDELNEANLTSELQSLLTKRDRQSQLQSDYTQLYEKLGGRGASERTAKEMLIILKAD